MNQAAKNLIAVLLSIFFAAYLITTSLGQPYPTAFQFPLLIGALSILPLYGLFYQTIPKLKNVVFKFELKQHKKMFIALFYLLLSINLYEVLGFYAMSWLLFILVSLTFKMNKGETNKEKSLEVLKTLGISFLFMLVIYLLFGGFLKVQTPEGILM